MAIAHFCAVRSQPKEVVMENYLDRYKREAEERKEKERQRNEEWLIQMAKQGKLKYDLHPEICAKYDPRYQPKKPAPQQPQQQKPKPQQSTQSDYERGRQAGIREEQRRERERELYYENHRLVASYTICCSAYYHIRVFIKEYGNGFKYCSAAGECPHGGYFGCPWNCCEGGPV